MDGVQSSYIKHLCITETIFWIVMSIAMQLISYINKTAILINFNNKILP